MRPTMENFLDAIESMGAIIPFFPAERKARALLAQILFSFVNTKEELGWLVLEACQRLRDWDKAGGVVELRGIFCTRFNPRDGRISDCTTPGMSTDEAESRYLVREMEENQRRFEGYQIAALAAPEKDRQPFPLLEAKRIPGLKKTIQ